ncbi:MAG: carbamoyl-phosphate synthase small subunit [Actinomycetota bacterium]|nr:carbamoyl-phosphate synthase small subunit [Actinomycetota bacterium]
MTRGLRVTTLALEDGTIFRGAGFGAHGTFTGEVCFNTSLTGYQEVLTDPSYHGQIVTMTAVQIGNTGVNAEDEQAPRPWVAGFVVRNLSETYSSWRANGSLDDYLIRHGIPGIAEVDTRRLTRHIRDQGAMRGAISDEVLDGSELVDRARASRSMVGLDLAAEVSTREPYSWGPAELEARGIAPALEPPADDERFRVAALDFGLKRNILDLLVASGCDVTVLPARTSADVILEGGYQGLFLSNGPGDPEPVTYGVETVRSVLGRLPVFGICLGHQILGLAVGARTFKLPFGHRGGNHPVKRTGHDRVEITCQNHGFAVEPHSLQETAAELTHVNLNDGTVEGLALPGVAYSVQYHPESAPGPHDSRYLFHDFRQLMKTFEVTDTHVSV